MYSRWLRSCDSCAENANRGDLRRCKRQLKETAYLIVEAGLHLGCVAADRVGLASVLRVDEDLGASADATLDGANHVVAAKSRERGSVTRDAPALAAEVAVLVEPNLARGRSDEHGAGLVVEVGANELHVASEDLRLALVLGIRVDFALYARAAAEGADLVIAANGSKVSSVNGDLPAGALVVTILVEPNLVGAGA